MTISRPAREEKHYVPRCHTITLIYPELIPVSTSYIFSAALIASAMAR